MDTKISKLSIIYDMFEEQARPYKTHAACQKGCAFCCTHAGAIHITTLEGLAIGRAMDLLAKPQRAKTQKALNKDMHRREKGLASPCPFLMKNKACMIYAARPFACRRVYSLEICNKEQPPILSRHVMDLGESTITTLQQLDGTGYSGHLSYILHMLNSPKFTETYLAGNFKPEEVTDFGKSHNILINRMVSKR